MYIFFEKGMRGGTSYISDKYSKINNKNLKYYDPETRIINIMHFYANNLYGYAMFKLLPTRGLKWLDSKELNSKDSKFE